MIIVVVDKEGRCWKRSNLSAVLSASEDRG